MKERRARPEEIVAAMGSERAVPEVKHKRAPKPKARRSHAKIAIGVVVITLAILGAIVYDGYHSIYSPESGSNAAVPFIVQPGDTTKTVANRLENIGLLHDGFLISGSELFQIDARVQGLASHLEAGAFTLKRNMSINQMISALGSGNATCTTVMIRPGLRAEEVAHALNQVGLNGAGFLREVKHPTIIIPGLHIGWPRHHTLEGFLYPDTYCVAKGSDGEKLAQAMLTRFAEIFGPTLRHAAKREHRSVYRIVKLASIVEREDYYVWQKPLIARTYYNRLHLPRGADGGVGHLLESDPTVSYAAGNRHKKQCLRGNARACWPVVTAWMAHHLHSPYNTYLHYGLPPGPISNPDLSSLEAAVHPAKRRLTYLYFASCPGQTLLHFQNTLAQQSTFLNSCTG